MCKNIYKNININLITDININININIHINILFQKKKLVIWKTFSLMGNGRSVNVWIHSCKKIRLPESQMRVFLFIFMYFQFTFVAYIRMNN